MSGPQFSKKKLTDVYGCLVDADTGKKHVMYVTLKKLHKSKLHAKNTKKRACQIFPANGRGSTDAWSTPSSSSTRVRQYFAALIIYWSRAGGGDLCRPPPQHNGAPGHLFWTAMSTAPQPPLQSHLFGLHRRSLGVAYCSEPSFLVGQKKCIKRVGPLFGPWPSQGPGT